MNPAEAAKSPEERVGRYAIFDEIAAGGMATVHLARLAGPEGFSRVVAVKRLHRHLLQDPEFKRMLLAEARLAARVRHPNVVPILDVLVHRNEIIIVMDYVHGESLATLIRTSHLESTPIPLSIACAIMVSVLEGLHAAHEARDEKGEPLGLVHRDVSPHNVLVGSDGVARVLDFGVAKAMQARQDTHPGVLKGKFSYMAPEVLRGQQLTRQADVFSASVTFWETLTGRKLFGAATEQERLASILMGNYPSPRQFEPTIPLDVERLVMRGLEPDTSVRYATALEMAVELERKRPLASQRIVGEWVSRLASDALARRAALLQQIEVSTIARSSWSDQLAPSGHSSGFPAANPAADYSVGLTKPCPAVERRRRWRWLGPVAAALVVATAALGFWRHSVGSSVRTAANAVTSAPAAAAVAPPPARVETTPAPAIDPAARETPPSVAPSSSTVPMRAAAPPPGPSKRKGHAKDFLPEDL
jgi:eukaryotic-like serine/threonine-protein kinase